MSTTDNHTTADPQAAIELSGVISKLGGVQVLDDVNLTIPSGRITALLGPSGAGKTVTVKHILGLMKPAKGRVVVEGRNLRRISDEELNELRRGMGVVLQGTLPFTCGLFFSLNVYDNVAFALRQRTNWSEPKINEATLAHLDMVGMRERADAMPDELSAGMCKRTALARALALEARIVIIDDFDSGLDGVRLALLTELIRDAQRDTGATFLVTTHDMTTARELADHAAVIHDGRIVASGDADSIFGSTDPLVRQLISGGTAGPLQLQSP
jgi:phospholipid/cholesterol/gamma-HCH transport system ATP-binding protein